MLSIWKEVVWEVNRNVLPFAGFISKANTESFSVAWQKCGISAFIIDSAKTHTQLIEQTYHIWDNLNLGSVVHLMDFAKTPQVELVYLLLKAKGYLSTVYMSFCASPWTFVVEKRLSWSLIQEFSTSKVPCSSVVQGFEQIEHDIKWFSLQTGADPELVECTRKMILKRQQVAEQECAP